MRLDLTREQAIAVRGSVSAELDIIDSELDDPRNKIDLDISRTRMLNKQILLSTTLDKINKAIRHV